MGTRGIMAFSFGAATKPTYVHFDSYPTYLGKQIAEWTAKLDDAAVAEAIEKFNNLQAVSEDEVPTEDQKLALLKYADFGVSTQSSDDWYVLLRDTQGDPQAVLDAGFYMPHPWGEEWAYDISLDQRTVTIYAGGLGEGEPAHTYKFGEEPSEVKLAQIERGVYEDED